MPAVSTSKDRAVARAFMWCGFARICYECYKLHGPIDGSSFGKFAGPGFPTNSRPSPMLRDWKPKVTVARGTPVALSLQITQAIVEKIRIGLLRSGEALPGTRELAEQLGVNRKTVVVAYDELISQGWLVAQGKRGTFVSPQLPEVQTEAKARMIRHASKGRLPSPDYRPYGVERPLPEVIPKDFIEFTDGVPDTRVVPFSALSSAFRLALLETARGNRLGYGDPRGLVSLRRLLASMLRMERGLNADEETLCLVRGSQMGIYLAARLLIRPGDVVAIERLTYPPARDAFRACGATIVSIEQDEHGLIPQSLERLCRRNRIRAIYITPHHQFPTTVTLPVERRLRLLDLAEQFGFVIVEDDYDHEFHFAHMPMLPMASVDYRGKVLYIGSLSKVLAPGLRIGYIVAPKEIVNRIANEVMLIDRQGNSVTERAAVELMENGELKRHIRRALKVYEARRDLMIQLVRDKLGFAANFRPPDGGLALWLRLDERIDMARLEHDALTARVSVLPGTAFSDQQMPVNALRLGYGSLNERELALGLERLTRVIGLQF